MYLVIDECSVCQNIFKSLHLDMKKGWHYAILLKRDIIDIDNTILT